MKACIVSLSVMVLLGCFGCRSWTRTSAEEIERRRQSQATSDMLSALAAEPEGALAHPAGRAGPPPELVSGIRKERAKKRQKQFERELMRRMTR